MQDFVIVTASDAAMEELAIGLHQSLGPEGGLLKVIDIGLSASARVWLRDRDVEILALPRAAQAAAALDRSYLAAMYLRPLIPHLVRPGSDILWIDADCWVQDHEALVEFRQAAAGSAHGFAVCSMIDPDYPGCMTNLVRDQDWYRDLHRPLFGEACAEFLYGRAVLSSGVFAARHDSPVWAVWEREVRRIYEEVRPTGTLAHMAEQCALNRVLHERGAPTVLRSENNWHCHGCRMERRDGRVVIASSGRAPRIVHLSNFRGMEAEYRAGRLLFEPQHETATDWARVGAAR